MAVLEKLFKVQQELKAPKNKNNSSGNYKYRSAEDILEAVKPLLKAQKLVMALDDEIIEVNNCSYVKAKVTLYDIEAGDSFNVSASAREADIKNGMDDSQITGATSSYARKYALNGLFLIDDTKDADSDEWRLEQEKKAEYEAKKIKKQPITQANVDALILAAKAKDISEDKILARYGKTDLMDLTQEEWTSAMRCIDKSPCKQE